MAEANIDDAKCVLCRCDFAEGCRTTVGEKGLQTLLQLATERRIQDLKLHLQWKASTRPIEKVYVHHNCRRKFVKKVANTDIGEQPAPKKLRSSLPRVFNWASDCFLCGDVAVFDSRHPERNKVIQVQTLHFRQTILKICDERNDSWSEAVKQRLESCIDMVAVEAVYHKSCKLKFNFHNISNTDAEGEKGRPNDKVMFDNFIKLCSWIENDAGAEPLTISELHDKMTEIAGGSSVYSPRHLKQKIAGHYKDCVSFVETKGKSDVVYFKKLADFIIKNMHFSKRTNISEEKKRVVQIAASIIKAELREREFDTDIYPSNEEISSVKRGKEWLPESLKQLLEILIPSSELKQVSIGHCILQAVRPRSVIPPVPFGLGVDVDHAFGSRWLVDQLARLGFSISSDEVRRYKQSVITEERSVNADYAPGAFVQWVADNVDHNVATIDGKGTFHGMGIIAVATPGRSTSKSHFVKRLKERKKAGDLIEGKGVPLFPFIGQIQSDAKLRFDPYITLNKPLVLPIELSYDLMWHSAALFSSIDRPRPSWSAFMQHTFSAQDRHFSKSDIFMLPIIDLNPSDETCIYSTLLFVQQQSQKLNIVTPCITFDQPLWLKATCIIMEKKLNIVCRLGGFHTLMSFMGSIGMMMSGSGLEEVLAEVYAKNAVPHIMSGKAFSRALRGHFLIESALMTLLLSMINNSTEEPVEAESNLSVEEAYHNVLEKPPTDNKSMEVSSLVGLQKKLESLTKDLQGQSRTAKLWLQYIDYIGTIKLFIRAERTGNWHLHLFAVKRMLNLFAASGHVHYAKSARLYLQKMMKLQDEHPWLYQCFLENGYHVIRRSDRYWAGLWSDLVIEQTMMRSIKSRGGLTGGRGMTESVRHLWVLTVHKCAEVHDVMSNLTQLTLSSSEQHAEMGSARKVRDFKDLETVRQWVNLHSPFLGNETGLTSLSSGIVAAAESRINCDQSEEIGHNLQVQLDNVSLSDSKIKRSLRIVPLESLCNSVQIGTKRSVLMRPATLFTRLIAIAQRNDDIQSYFEYELTTFPMSLFDGCMMRKPNKPVIRNLFLKISEKTNLSAQRVLDGGALLHRVRWPGDCTFRELCNVYVDFVRTNHHNCCVIFDGYQRGASTKDHEHQRRSAKRRSLDIKVDLQNKVKSSREDFLCNSANKSQLVAVLHTFLTSDHQEVHVSEDDADATIAENAINKAAKGSYVNVFTDDTDVAVLLLHHWNPTMADITFVSEKAEKSWSIGKAWRDADPAAREHILFLHAWTGCDTTSAIYAKGKKSLFNQIQSSKELQTLAECIGSCRSSPNDVSGAGRKVFVIMYGGRNSDTLASLRYKKFLEMAARGEMLPEKLPPTERAAHFHSLRVHLQIATWKTFGKSHLDPLEWGWQLKESRLEPVATDAAVAPEDLLKFIRCKCKPSKRQCGTNQCSCRRNDLKCVQSCGDCRGELCHNAEVISSDIGEEAIDEFQNIFEILDHL